MQNAFDEEDRIDQEEVFAQQEFHAFVEANKEDLFAFITSSALIMGLPAAYICSSSASKASILLSNRRHLVECEKMATFCHFSSKTLVFTEFRDLDIDNRFNRSTILSLLPKARFASCVQLVAQGVQLGSLNFVSFDASEVFEETKIRKALLLVDHILLSFKLFKSVQTEKEIKQKLKAHQTLLMRQKVASFANSKFRSIGELSKGFMHEISNPLAVVLGRIAIMESWCESDAVDIDRSKLFKGLVQVKNASERIATSIDTLRFFVSATDATVKAEQATQVLIENTVKLMAERFKIAQINLIVDPIPTMIAMCHRSQIAQVLVNILSNALEACADAKGNKVHLRFPLKDGFFVCEVADNGPGVDPEICDSLFNAFVTTKLPAQGLGVGLSVALSHIEAHQGKIEHKRMDDNTIFTIIIPAKIVEQEQTNSPDLKAVA